MAEVEQRPVPIEAIPIDAIPINAIPASTAAAAPAPSASEPVLEKTQVESQSQTQDAHDIEPIEPAAVKSVPERIQQPSIPVTEEMVEKDEKAPVVAEAHLVDTYRKFSSLFECIIQVANIGFRPPSEDVCQ